MWYEVSELRRCPNVRAMQTRSRNLSVLLLLLKNREVKNI